jgi:hypothetical protein
MSAYGPQILWFTNAVNWLSDRLHGREREDLVAEERAARQARIVAHHQRHLDESTLSAAGSRPDPGA